MDTTKQATHTPGPWVAVGNSEVHDRPTEYDKDGSRTGETPNLVAALGYPHHDAPTLAANARLIAAAPELLEALRWAVETIDEAGGMDPDDRGAIAQCRAAIAKATGQA